MLVLNGPNMNMLGVREPEKYGTASLQDLETSLQKSAETFKCSLTCRQSNAESELINWLHAAKDEGFAGVIFNPAAYAHTSVALCDAVAACQVPVVEVHLTNIHGREEFRRTSLVSPVADGVITGLGVVGYLLAMQALLARSAPPTRAS